jgi:hypothetical protein
VLFRGCLTSRSNVTPATAHRRGRGANFGDPTGRPLRQVNASGPAIDN